MYNIIRYDQSKDLSLSGLVEAGGFLYISFCVGNVGQPVEAQINGAFDHLEKRLQSVGLTLDAVVKIDALFRDVWNIPLMEKVIRERYPKGNYPARKSLQTEFAHKGGGEGLQFQLDAIAYRGSVMLSAFPPLHDGKAHTLILGTFPSPLSREKGEYYGNPNNQFWRLLFGAFDAPFDNPDYEAKKAFLFAKGIALCDVVVACEAKNALDTSIRNPVYRTALPDFITEQGIQKVLFNGNNAYTLYRRGIGDIERKVLPSSSPANARTGFEEKLRLWREGLLDWDS